MLRPIGFEPVVGPPGEGLEGTRATDFVGAEENRLNIDTPNLRVVG
ncbi:MAG TPA: hypothetical protein VIS06_16375 [Mycobacteriales bacterium]